MVASVEVVVVVSEVAVVAMAMVVAEVIEEVVVEWEVAVASEEAEAVVDMVEMMVAMVEVEEEEEVDGVDSQETHGVVMVDMEVADGARVVVAEARVSTLEATGSHLIVTEVVSEEDAVAVVDTVAITREAQPSHHQSTPPHSPTLETQHLPTEEERRHPTSQERLTGFILET